MINRDPNGQSQEKGMSIPSRVFFKGQKSKIRNQTPEMPDKEPGDRHYSPLTPLPQLLLLPPPALSLIRRSAGGGTR